MKFSSFILFVLLFLTLGACNKSGTKALGNQGSLDQEIRVRYGSFVAIPSENLSISFNKVRESRCPVDAKCIQAGEANASFLVTKANQSESLVLTAKGNCQSDSGTCGQEKRVLNYTIQLTKLAPYPGVGEQGEEFYIAYLKVSKHNIQGDQR
ncbi:MAG: hypothetical protein AAF985_18510 [Bacteroidota bacterium]